MSNISEYKINALPSKTWYWLNLNDTKVAWDSEVTPCSITTCLLYTSDAADD